jgi:hypothetical protein
MVGGIDSVELMNVLRNIVRELDEIETRLDGIEKRLAELIRMLKRLIGELGEERE